ncbi:MAG: hypothetical protein M3372_04100 [Verrucomicrobiota bacterium]|nr:hypothetical protein [Verrucomicrobiota bacterium]
MADGELFAFGDGEGVGDAFFVVAVVLFRFFGGGVGLRTLLILSPNDCASAGGTPNVNATAHAKVIGSSQP